MIPNQWYAVLESREVPVGQPVGVTHFGEKLIQVDQPIIAYRRRRQELIDAAATAKDR